MQPMYYVRTRMCSRWSAWKAIAYTAYGVLCLCEAYGASNVDVRIA